MGPLKTRTFGIVAGIGAAIIAVIWWQFYTDIASARSRAAQGSTVIETPCGLIEYQDVGSGKPLLAVHGSGGGYDQGMAFAYPLTSRGIRVIAMSRFGYLRTPMPEGASAQAQADAFGCLLDALAIPEAAVMGGSAGAVSALQMAIRHPTRVSALILLVPLAYKPPSEANSAAPMAPWIENLMMTAIGSDFLFWSGLHLARGQLIGTVLATPPELLDTASLSEQARINAMMDTILPVSARAAGLRYDTAASKSMAPARLDLVLAPTLIISARDDRYGTYASAQFMASQISGAWFLGFETGGHTWIGHNDDVMDAIAGLVKPAGAVGGP
jgi:2-hydroxy-6-oxonona-2,4-dienedioate hydrolase